MAILIFIIFLGAFVGFWVSGFAMSMKISDSEALRIMVLLELLPTLDAIDSLFDEQNKSNSDQSLRVLKSRIENACKKIETF
jgi:multisubunit Na+/H+ antiporter MnhE subunit